MAAKKSTKSQTKKKKIAKKASKKAPAKKAAAGKKASSKKKTAAKKQAAKSASTRDVHLGHVFGLRPRVEMSFRQEHFREARRLLEDESYPNPAAAARAVAEKALELTHDGPPKRL